MFSTVYYLYSISGWSKCVDDGCVHRYLIYFVFVCTLQELKDPQCRDEMAAARGALKKNATMLYTASQAFLRHPDVAATRANRDYVFKQVQEAIGGISSAAQATSPTEEKHGHAGIGELAAALNEFDVSLLYVFLGCCIKVEKENVEKVYHTEKMHITAEFLRKNHILKTSLFWLWVYCIIICFSFFRVYNGYRTLPKHHCRNVVLKLFSS